MKEYRCELLEVDGLADMLIEWDRKHVDEFYDIDTTRERMSPALSKTRSYFLRIPNIDLTKIVRTESAQHVLQCVDTKLFLKFPVIHEFIERVGQRLFGGWAMLGRVFITRLGPAEKISRHIDEGFYFEKLHRFHVPLKSSGARFMWDDDSVLLERGFLYRVNNSIPHWVENGVEYRTHLIFDGCQT